MTDTHDVLGGDKSIWPTVGVVVINWNNYDDTSECLKSLSRVEYPHLEIVVVDNGSTDGSVERLQEEFDYRFLINDENRGFAAANNRGIEVLLDAGVDHVLLLNNDMVVTKDFLPPMVATAENNKNIAGVGGLVRYYDTKEVWSAGGKHIPCLVKNFNLTEYRDQTYETNFVSPALILLTNSFLKSGHRLDEGYFFSVEDQQLAYDARKNGWRFLVNPRAVVYHKEGGTAGTLNPFRFYHYTRGRLRFAAVNLPVTRLIVFLIFFLTSRLIRFGQWGIKGRMDLIKVTIVAFYDYITGADLKGPSEFDI